MNTCANNAMNLNLPHLSPHISILRVSMALDCAANAISLGLCGYPIFRVGYGFRSYPNPTRISGMRFRTRPDPKFLSLSKTRPDPTRNKKGLPAHPSDNRLIKITHMYSLLYRLAFDILLTTKHEKLQQKNFPVLFSRWRLYLLSDFVALDGFVFWNISLVHLSMFTSKCGYLVRFRQGIHNIFRSAKPKRRNHIRHLPWLNL